MVAWASRRLDLGVSAVHPLGRSKPSPAVPAGAAGPDGGVLGAAVPGAGAPFEEIGPTPVSGAGAAGGAASVAAGAGAWAVWEEVDSGWPPQAARPKRRIGSRAAGPAGRVIVRVLVESRERITWRYRNGPHGLESARKRSGAGASRGLQNRCPVPVAVRGVGSIPMRFRQSAPQTLIPPVACLSQVAQKGRCLHLTSKASEP